MSQTMVVIVAESVGRGDEDLGRRLMIKLFGQLATLPGKPHVIAFYNAGVKLLARDSPIADVLGALDAQGVDLVACGTCVDHFALRDRLAFGRISDMREIVSAMLESDKVITP